MYVSDVNGNTSLMVLSTAYATANIEIPSNVYATRCIRHSQQQILREAYCYISPKGIDDLPKEYCAREPFMSGWTLE